MMNTLIMTALMQATTGKSNIEMFLDTLPIMGIGMLGVFVVVGIIILLTTALTKIFSEK